MSRILFIAVTLTLAFVLLAGCGTSAAPAYSDEKVPISAGAGEPFVIALASNPTTGYSWQLDYDKTILTLAGKDYAQDAGAAGRIGAGGTEKFTFQGIKAGTTKITLTYKQPWQGGQTGETKVFNVTIK